MRQSKKEGDEALLHLRLRFRFAEARPQMSSYSQIKTHIEKFKGSSKDPFLYLGITAGILFLLVSFATNFVSSSSNAQAPFAFSTEDFSQEPFIGSIKKSGLDLPDFLLVQNSSIRAAVPPITITPQVLGMWLGEGEIREISEYVVEEGDNLWLIAAKFDISLDTILWANNLKSLLIQPSQKLLILPVSGVMHLVKEGETISGLAEKYKTEAEKIIAFNDLSDEDDLIADEVLIVPDGKFPSVSIVQPVESFSGYSTNNFYGQSHSFPWGQCTWWVAQKRPIPGWGNAKDWIGNAIISGFSVCKGSWCIPQVGAVISLKGNRYYGHVAYVEEVKGDKVVFSEMNYIGLGKMNYRTLRVGSPSIRGYIY